MIDPITIAIGFGLKLFAALTVFIIMRLALSNLDKAIGFDFKEWIDSADHPSKALYLGCRFIGCAIIFGLALL